MIWILAAVGLIVAGAVITYKNSKLDGAIVAGFGVASGVFGLLSNLDIVTSIHPTPTFTAAIYETISPPIDSGYSTNLPAQETPFVPIPKKLFELPYLQADSSLLIDYSMLDLFDNVKACIAINSASTTHSGKVRYFLDYQYQELSGSYIYFRSGGSRAPKGHFQVSSDGNLL